MTGEGVSQSAEENPDISKISPTSSDKPTILIIGTLDTKLDETLFLRSQILNSKTCDTILLDVGRERPSATTLGIPDNELVPRQLKIADPDPSLPRGEFIDETILRCKPIVTKLVSNSRIHGIVSAGGSSGSSLATALMRACPVGLPKLMVSTMASGDIKHYIEETDVTMMYSVVDIAGVNSILRRILSNAAGAIVGMANAYFKSLPGMDKTTSPPPPGRPSMADRRSSMADSEPPKRIAITMFGVTTPCVDQIRSILATPPHDEAYEIYVFHATGAGGKAMERLINESQIDAVLDITTTEIADHLFDGVLSAGPRRLEAALKGGIPTVLSVGACDMVNFGPRSTVPTTYQDRNLHVHNPSVTLMRTTPGENSQIGGFIVDKIKSHCADPSKLRVLLPTKGISMLDTPNQPFHDPDADHALFSVLETGLAQPIGTGGTTSDDNQEKEAIPKAEIKLTKLDCAINDELFAAECVKNLLELLDVAPRKWRLANQRRRRWSFDHGL